MNRRVTINLAFFSGVFVLMLWWAINNVVTVDAIEKPYSIQADFAQAAGVRKDAEVTYLGVHYGRVSSVALREGGVRVSMKIDKGRELPAGAIARIFRKSAIGEPYIDFTPPKGEDPPKGTIRAGDLVPQARTTVPLEFSELLRSAGALVGSIEPEDAGSLVHELALGLAGRGEDLRDLTTGFDQLSATFAERTDELDRLAENSTRITNVLADHRLSIGRSITNLRAVADSLRNSRGDLEALFRDGPGFLTATANLVAEQKANLDCLLTDLAPVLRLAATPEHRQGLATLLEQGPQGFGYVFSAVDREPDGPWIRVNLALPVGGTDPKIYSPRPSLPVVPTVSPCASTMTPASTFRAPVDQGPARSPVQEAASAGPATALAGPAPTDARSVLADPIDLAGAGRPVASPAAALALALLAGVAALYGTQRRTGAR